MVEYHVHHGFDAALVKQANKSGVVVVATETRVDTIVVGRRIAMVATARHIVFEHRIDPHGRDAERVDIIDVTNQAFQVATMAHIVVCTISTDRMTHLIDAIVLRIAIGKSVGHNHIHHIGGSEAVSPLMVGLTSTQLKLFLHLLATFLESQRILARLSLIGEIEVDKQVVVATIESSNAIDSHAGDINLHIRVLDTLAIDLQLQ